MKKLIFLFALAFFASCETAIENLAISVSMPIVNIATPSVPSGTYTISKEISIDSLNSEIQAQSGKNLDEVTDFAIDGLTVNIVTPDTLTFSSFSYAKLSVSAGVQNVTLFDNAISNSTRSYPYTLPSSIKNVIAAARQGNGKLVYTLTVAATKSIPTATWKIETKAVVTP